MFPNTLGYVKSVITYNVIPILYPKFSAKEFNCLQNVSGQGRNCNFSLLLLRLCLRSVGVQEHGSQSNEVCVSRSWSNSLRRVCSLKRINNIYVYQIFHPARRPGRAWRSHWAHSKLRALLSAGRSPSGRAAV